MTEPNAGCLDNDVIADLALGELTGRDRAAALEHITGCLRCRRELDALIDSTEQVLLATPDAEPPIGFEAAVVRGIHDAPMPQRPQPAILAAAAAVLAVIVLGAALLLPNDPSKVVEARMLTPSGRDVGAVWRYDERPGWLFLSVPGWQAWDDPTETPHDYRLRATLADGTTVDLGTVAFDGDHGDWGTTFTVEAERIRRVAIVDEADRIWCEGAF